MIGINQYRGAECCFVKALEGYIINDMLSYLVSSSILSRLEYYLRMFLKL